MGNDSALSDQSGLFHICVSHDQDFRHYQYGGQLSGQLVCGSINAGVQYAFFFDLHHSHGGNDEHFVNFFTHVG